MARRNRWADVRTGVPEPLSGEKTCLSLKAQRALLIVAEPMDSMGQKKEKRNIPADAD